MTPCQPNTLHAHREALSRNPNAYTADLSRVYGTAVSHLKACGYKRVTTERCGPLIREFVDRIFATQDRLPFFHIEIPNKLPFCWNAPKGWKHNFICYEWGHLHSRNQNPGNCENLENLCLQSARCNQHIQTSMDIDEVIAWLNGSPVAERARQVLNRRRQLFESPEWKLLKQHLEQFRISRADEIASAYA